MLPLEVLVTLGSGALGFLFQLTVNKQQNTQKLVESRLKEQDGNDKSADAAASRSKGFNWTKRFITTAVTLAALSPVWAPIVGALNDLSISVVYGYWEFHPGALFLPDKNVLVWKEIISGNPLATIKIVITPGMSQAFYAIIGTYFGHSIGKNQ